MKPDYHSVVEQIKTLLKENSFCFEPFEHEPVRTSLEASRIRTGYGIEQGTKALIVKTSKLAGLKTGALSSSSIGLTAD